MWDQQRAQLRRPRRRRRPTPSSGNPDGTPHYFENTGSATAPAPSTGVAGPFDGVDVGSRHAQLPTSTTTAT
jgi:hypothetical protein